MKINLNELTCDQLAKLRKEVVLGSIFTHDFENSFGIPRDICQNFFDGFNEYIGELMLEDGHDADEYWDLISHYDTSSNLYDWYCCCEMPFGEELYKNPIISDDEEDK